MRILLDENMDRKLMHAFKDVHEVTTVRDQGWSGMKNGDLLRAAEAAFDVLITLDRNMQYQQNLSSYDLAVVLIMTPSSRRKDIEPAMSAVNRILDGVKPGTLQIIAA